MKCTREKTRLVVKVLDLSEGFKKMQEQEKREHDIDCEFSSRPVGYIVYKGYSYLLCNEGVLHSIPVEIEPASHDIIKSVKIDTNSERCTSIIIELNTEDLQEFFKGEKKNLAQFVRQFGGRLESNYHEILQFFKGK